MGGPTNITAQQATQQAYRISGEVLDNNARQIAQANNEEFVRETPIIKNTRVGMPVSAGAIQHIPERQLADYRHLLSVNGASSAQANPLREILDTLGTPNSRSDIAALFARMHTHLQHVCEGSDTGESFIQSAKDLTSEVRRVSSQIQSVRKQADQNIYENVLQVNNLVEELETLNEQMVIAGAAGHNSNEANNIRNMQRTVITELHSFLDIDYTVTSGGQIHVSIGSVDLLGLNGRSEISFSPIVGNATAFISGDTIQVNGSDISDAMTGGSIKGHFEIRDTAGPNAAERLDEWVRGLYNSFNAVHNQGSARTPQVSLVGQRPIEGTTSITGAGTVRLTIMDTEGGYVSHEELDLNTYATLGNLITAMNGVDHMDASIENDILKLEADNGYTIAISGTGTITEGAVTSSVSNFFGLNNLFTLSTWQETQDASLSPGLGAALHVNSNLTRHTLSIAQVDETATQVGNVVIRPGDNNNGNALLAYFNEHERPIEFLDSGGIKGGQVTLLGRLTSIISQSRSEAAIAKKNAKIQQENLNTAKKSYLDEAGVDTQKVITDSASWIDMRAAATAHYKTWRESIRIIFSAFGV